MRALVLLVLLAAASLIAAAEKTTVAQGDWSEPVDGIRGRLIVAQGPKVGDGKTKESLIYIELQNVADASDRSVYFDPAGLTCELQDANGKAVPKTPFFGSGGRPVKAWVRLPHDSTLRLRANPYAFGQPDNVGLLIPLGADTWLIKAGDTADYFLAGTFKCFPKDGVAINVWTGELKLPKAKVVRPKATVDSAQPVGQKDDPNPVFDGWKGVKPGTAVTVRQAQNSNGALTEGLITYTLIEVGPDALVLEGRYSDVQKKMMQQPAKVTIPRRIRLTADDRNELAVPLVPDGVYEEGTETVTITGTAYKARWYKYWGGAGDSTYEGRKWISVDVPGLLLKTEHTSQRPMITTTFTVEVVEVKQP